MGNLKNMAVAATAVVALATIALTGIAVITGYKQTGLVDNTTADDFIAGLAIFGTFMGVIALAIVGKIIIGMFKPED